MPPTPSMVTLDRLLFRELKASQASEISPRVRPLEQIGGAIGTHVGSRRNRNEDCAAVMKYEHPGDFSYTLAVVCDGVGGSDRGDEAAALACAAVIAHICRTRAYQRPSELIREAVLAADQSVRAALSGDGTTTLSMFLASDRDDYATTNIGDSRVYSWAAGSDLIQLSEDDTIENELKNLDIKSPGLLEERGLRGSLSQALGEADRSLEQLKVVVTGKKQIPPGGIILATDGIWKSDEAAFRLVAKNCRSSLDVARRTLTLASWLGGVDNATILAIEEPENFSAQLQKEELLQPLITIWTPTNKASFIFDSEKKIPVSTSDSEVKARRRPARKRKSKVEPSKHGGKAEQLDLPTDPPNKPERVRPHIDVSSDDS